MRSEVAQLTLAVKFSLPELPCNSSLLPPGEASLTKQTSLSKITSLAVRANLFSVIVC